MIKVVNNSVGNLRRGFTLIEILMVVIIIGTLAAMLIPRLTGRSDQARYAAAKADVTVNVTTALKLYELDNGFFPSTEQGLDALLAKPTTNPVPQNWNGPYLENLPVDPWGRPYQYRSPGANRPHDYDLWSMGKNSTKEKSDDDVTNWGSSSGGQKSEK
jgi:general secretion pathway protein G